MQKDNYSISTYIWSLTDVLRGDFKVNQYYRILLPFILLYRLNFLLKNSKPKVLEIVKKGKEEKWSEQKLESHIKEVTSKLPFYNTSSIVLSDVVGITVTPEKECELVEYIKGFSQNIIDIFDGFDFLNTIDNLKKHHLIDILMHKMWFFDFTKEKLSDDAMGHLFDEILRRCIETSTEVNGEHFTSRDITNLISLILAGDTTSKSKIDIFDSSVGTGGCLADLSSYIFQRNSNCEVNLFGQDINPETISICKAYLLISGKDVNNIRVGNSLTEDAFIGNKFDLLISMPPFGLSWERFKYPIIDEYKNKGYDGRFGPGVPRVSDGSLLFLQNLISKLRSSSDGGAKAGIILNGSALKNGDAGSGESEIRRYLVENDLLEAIIALPSEIFINTTISTYLLIFSNSKKVAFRNKVKIINAKNLGMKLRKSIGSKKVELDSDTCKQILELYTSEFGGENEFSRLVDTKELGFRRVKIRVEGDQFEFEKIPLDEDISSFLNKSLKDVHKKYSIEKNYVDHLDKKIGVIGFSYSIKHLFYKDEIDAKPFRAYFKKVSVDDLWDFCLPRIGHKPIFKGIRSVPKEKQNNYTYFKIKNECINSDYLKYFFLSESWTEWLNKYRSDGTYIQTNTNVLWREPICFPSPVEQSSMVEVFDGIEEWTSYLCKLRSDIWQNKGDLQIINKFQLPHKREFDELLVDAMPFPIANLIHHYKSIGNENYKDRYELQLKLFECLNILIVSILSGELKGEIKFAQLLRQQKRFLKNASFGTWNTLLSKLMELKVLLVAENTGKRELEINDKMFENLVDLFQRAVDIRNETSGHGSYPTEKEAKKNLKATEELFDLILPTFYEFFSQYSLIRPIHSTWDGKSYSYEVEEFTGLGSYPFGLKTTETEKPFRDGSLYLIANNNPDLSIEIYPFIRLADIEGDSGLEAFYFYSKLHETDNDHKDQYVFISHQQINRQKQLVKCEVLKETFE